MNPRKRQELLKNGPGFRIVVKGRATATVGLVGGNAPDVTYDPHTGEISVSGHGISFTDDGILNGYARHFQNDVYGVVSRIRDGRTKRSPIGPYGLSVSVAGKDRRTPISKVYESANLSTEDGNPVIDVELTTDFSIKGTSAKKVDVKYGVVISVEVERRGPHPAPIPRVTTLELEEVALIIASGVVAVPVIQKVFDAALKGELGLIRR